MPKRPQRMYWRFSSLPELEHLSEAQRRSFLRKYLPRGTWRALISEAVGVGLAGVIVIYIILGAMANRAGYRFADGAVASALACGFIGAGIANYQWRLRRIGWEVRRHIIEASRGEQLPVCLHCGYDLHAIKADHCPECGNPCRVVHGHAERRM